MLSTNFLCFSLVFLIVGHTFGESQRIASSRQKNLKKANNTFYSNDDPVDIAPLVPDEDGTHSSEATGCEELRRNLTRYQEQYSYSQRNAMQLQQKLSQCRLTNGKMGKHYESVIGDLQRAQYECNQKLDQICASNTVRLRNESYMAQLALENLTGSYNLMASKFEMLKRDVLIEQSKLATVYQQQLLAHKKLNNTLWLADIVAAKLEENPANGIDGKMQGRVLEHKYFVALDELQSTKSAMKWAQTELERAHTQNRLQAMEIAKLNNQAMVLAKRLNDNARMYAISTQVNNNMKAERDHYRSLSGALRQEATKCAAMEQPSIDRFCLLVLQSRGEMLGNPRNPMACFVVYKDQFFVNCEAWQTILNKCRGRATGVLPNYYN